MDSKFLITESVDKLIFENFEKSLNKIACRLCAGTKFHAHIETYNHTGTQLFLCAESEPINMVPAIFEKLQLTYKSYDIDVTEIEEDKYNIKIKGNLNWDWCHFNGGSNGCIAHNIETFINVKVYYGEAYVISAHNVIKDDIYEESDL